MQWMVYADSVINDAEMQYYDCHDNVFRSVICEEINEKEKNEANPSKLRRK